MSFKCVIASYVVEECFKVPSNIDLENKEQVESYFVKYNILHIKLKNGKEIKVDNCGWIHEHDFKHPEKVAVADAEEYMYDESDFEKVDIDVKNLEKKN